jgi:hypothetical protein
MMIATNEEALGHSIIDARFCVSPKCDLHNAKANLELIRPGSQWWIGIALGQAEESEIEYKTNNSVEFEEKFTDEDISVNSGSENARRH